MKNHSQQLNKYLTDHVVDRKSDRECLDDGQFLANETVTSLANSRYRTIFLLSLSFLVSISGVTIMLRGTSIVCNTTNFVSSKFHNVNNFDDDNELSSEDLKQRTDEVFIAHTSVVETSSYNNILSELYTKTRKLFDSSSSSTSSYVTSRSLAETKTSKASGSYKLLETVPHDASSYTQGLSILNMKNNVNDSISVLVEGTGLYGQSTLQYVNITDGKILQKHRLASKFFGEGITPYDYYPTPNNLSTRIIQITWQEQKAFVYDVYSNFTIEKNPILLFSPTPVLNFTYKTTTNEGWGITYRRDKHIMYVSDGSSNIHTWNATTFQQISVQQVRETKRHFFGLFVYRAPVRRLNELEWDPVSKTILANVYQTNRIVRIDPETGNVVSSYDFSALYRPRAISADVLNGIALTKNFETDKNNEVWVTGKLWPSMYRVQLIN